MSNKLDIAASCIQDALKNGADAADAVIFDSSNTSIGYRLGKLETIERAESNGLGLRVMVAGKKGYKQAIISSNDISKESLSDLIENAVSMAKLAPEDEFTGLADKSLLAREDIDLDLFDKDNADISPEILKEWAEKAENKALAIDGITNSEGSEAGSSISSFALVTSSGFAKELSSTNHYISVSVIAGSGTDMQSDYDYSMARHVADLADPESIGEKAGKLAVEKLNPRRVKTCRVPVIYDPRNAKGLLSSFKSAVNGASIARGTSFLKDSMEKKIFSNNINIIDDPLIIRGHASEVFDSEGVSSQKINMVESGILKSWLLDVRSANQLGLITNGRASRGISSPPSPSATNLYIENGTISVEELISDIKEGFYVTEIFGMGVNGITGDYSQGAGGFWIENGKITYPVSELTIAGNLKNMFLNITPANDLTFKYSTNSPTLRVEGMTVAGE